MFTRVLAHLLLDVQKTSLDKRLPSDPFARWAAWNFCVERFLFLLKFVCFSAVSYEAAGNLLHTVISTLALLNRSCASFTHVLSAMHHSHVVARSFPSGVLTHETKLCSKYRGIPANSGVRVLDSRARGMEIFCELLEAPGKSSGKKGWVPANVIDLRGVN
jgi:hypothetical protein